MKKAIILGMIMTCLLLSTAGFADSWWDGDWQYRRIITIDNAGGSLTEYQIAINVTYDSDMQSDFDDIKFIDSDDSTELNYWLQEKVDPEWAYFWVKIPSIPASSTKIIYMYYGNPSASSESDIQKTMITGDDFDDNNFNTTKWSTDANSGATEESNGILNVSCGFNVDSKRRHYTLEKNITTGILEGRVKIDDIENTVGHQYHALALSNVVEWWVDVDLASVDFNEGSEAENYVRCTTRNEGNYTDNHNPQDFVENNWVKFKIVLKSNEFATYYKNETLMHNHTTNVPDEPLFVLLTSETGQLGDVSSDFWTAYDWVFVRKYTYLEPTFSLGSEESSLVEYVSDCGILNETGETYILTQDINTSNTCFNIIADDIILDCNNHLIAGTGSAFSYGIQLSGGTNKTIKNCIVNGFFSNIEIDSSNGNIITNNTVYNNTYADVQLPLSSGIQLYSSNNNTIVNNIANNNTNGIGLYSSNNNTIVNNTANNNDNGTYVVTGSTANIIINNIFNHNVNGICIYYSENSTITNNTANWNSVGFLMKGGASFNNISSNFIINNAYGVYNDPIWNSINNIIYNNLFNNSINAYSEGYNIWNIPIVEYKTNIIGGPFTGGNYWSDYNGMDFDGNGIGDTPYTSGGANDWAPLVEYHPPCNCTELTEKVSELNSTVEGLKDRVETLEDNQGNVPSHTHPISDIIGLQSILDSIQNSLNKLIGILTYLPRGLRQDMVCDYMKAKSMTSLDALGLHCDSIKKNCKCKAIV